MKTSSPNPTSLLALACTICMIIAGCAKSVDPEDALTRAESQLMNGKIEQAATNCDMLADSTVSNLSPTQLCRVAIMYAKISEQSEKEDYMALAAMCFDRAVGLGRDSIDAYIEQLNVEDQSYLSVIREVTNALTSTYDYTGENDFEEGHDSDGGDGAEMISDINNPASI